MKYNWKFVLNLQFRKSEKEICVMKYLRWFTCSLILAISWDLSLSKVHNGTDGVSGRVNWGRLTCGASLAVWTRKAPYVDIVSANTDEEFQTKPTRVLIHGWSPSSLRDDSQDHEFSDDKISDNGEFDAIESAYKKYHKGEINLVIVKWSIGSMSYSAAQAYAKDRVAVSLANYLDRKLSTNESVWRNLKIIGHSLGAHIAGSYEKLQSKLNYRLTIHTSATRLKV